MVHMCFLHFFQILIFGVNSGAKNDPKWQKKLSHSVSQELYLIWLWFLVHTCKMMISPAIFFHFFKILISWVSQSSSINTKSKFWIVPHLHMCVIWKYNYCIINKGTNCCNYKIFRKLAIINMQIKPNPNIAPDISVSIFKGFLSGLIKSG